MLVQQDKAEEDLKQCWLGDAAQKKVQVGGCGHDLLHSHLGPTTERTQVSLPSTQCLSNGPRPHRSDPIKARTRLPQEHTSELHLKPLTYSHSSESHADSAF